MDSLKPVNNILRKLRGHPYPLALLTFSGFALIILGGYTKLYGVEFYGILQLFATPLVSSWITKFNDIDAQRLRS